MRRPHPYLAISLVCAAVAAVTLLAVACPAPAETVRAEAPEPVAADYSPVPASSLPIPATLPVVNGNPIWPGSPECPVYGPITYYPTRDRVRHIQAWARWALHYDMEAGLLGWGGITGGLKTPLPQAAWQTLFRYAEEAEPKFFDRAIYGAYGVPPGYTSNCTVDGVPLLCTCAQGVGMLHPWIALDQPHRTERLIAWETLNGLLCAMGRCDLADTQYVSTMLDAVEKYVGGWRTAP